MRVQASPDFVPASLVDRVGEALDAAGGDPTEPATQLRAAAACLRMALQRGDDRAAAFDLLAADALLTSACEAATLSGTGSVEAFAAEATDLLAGFTAEEYGQ